MNVSLLVAGVPADNLTEASIFLDREKIRLHVATHLNEKLPVEALGIEPNRPADTHDFAFVGRAPKRQRQTTWYRCSFCQTDRKFSAGRIVLSSDQKLRLIGDDCWTHHLDKDRFKVEYDDWKDYERRRQFAEVRDRLHPVLTALAEQLQDLLKQSSEVIKFVDQLPYNVRDHAPWFANILFQVRRNGRTLQVERSIIDHASYSGTGSRRYIIEAQPVHIVSGIDSVLMPPPEIERTLREALPLLYKAKHEISDTDWDNVTNARAKKAILSVGENSRDAVRKLTSASNALQQAHDFFNAINLSGIAKWGSDPDCELVLTDQSVRRSTDGLHLQANGSGFHLTKPNGLRRDLVPELADLKRLLDLS